MLEREVLDQVFSKSKFADYPYNESLDATIMAMREYAKLKCKELLEIVAEKAKIKEVDYEDEMEWVYHTIVDKDSILNVVDLDKFIV